MPATGDLLPLPSERASLSGIAPVLLALQREQPVVAVRTPAGDPAWLFTRHEHVKALLADDRLGRSHPDPPRAACYSRQALAGGPMGKWETEDEDHNTWRKLVAPSFTAKRIDSLSSAIQEMIDRLLDQMAEMTPPVDFHELVSFPLPVQVVGRLLGFPPDRSHELGSWCDAMAALQDPEKSAAGLAALRDYAGQLLQIKREQPGDDVFSDLVAASAVEPRLEQRATGLAARLLFAGHETTVSMIDAGLVHLLTKPDQRAAVLRDPSIASNTIEEILRYAFPSQDVLLRYARSELEVDGAKIKPGDLVLLNIQAANHDDKVFYDPSHFDIDRRHNPHLAFGYGRHYCIGASLARLELRIVLLTVLRRFPSLRLAIPPEELRLRDDLFTGGLQALPVAW